MKKHWLVKQEPSPYAWERFVADGKTDWTGVRNYQARPEFDLILKLSGMPQVPQMIKCHK
jgi:predicted RNA-binding protein with PUA-like domain